VGECGGEVVHLIYMAVISKDQLHVQSSRLMRLQVPQGVKVVIQNFDNTRLVLDWLFGNENR